MSFPIMSYFDQKSVALLELNAFSTSMTTRFEDDNFSYKQVKVFWDTYMKSQPHCMYWATFTSRYKRDSTFKKHLASQLAHIKNYNYVLYPAYQKKTSRLHYHGFIWFSEFKTYAIGHIRYDDVGLAQLNTLKKSIDQTCGWCTMSNVMADCKEKSFDMEREFKKFAEYIYSDKNYMNCNDHAILSNYLEKLTI